MSKVQIVETKGVGRRRPLANPKDNPVDEGLQEFPVLGLVASHLEGFKGLAYGLGRVERQDEGTRLLG